MKILISHPFDNVSEGLAQVISSIGEDLVIWNINQPIYDILEQSKPDLIFSRSQHLTNTVINALKEYKVEFVNLDELNIEPAANLAYHDIKYDEKYSTDIFYYSQNTSPEEMCYLQEIINRQYQLKIIGNKLPLSNYLGMGNVNDVIKFMKSCKIAIAFDIWTLYTYAANKVFCISNIENKLFPSFSQTSELTDLLNNCLEPTHPTATGLKKIDIKIAYNYIISNHTFFHKTYDIFQKLGHIEQADKCLTQLQKTIEQIN